MFQNPQLSLGKKNTGQELGRAPYNEKFTTSGCSTVQVPCGLYMRAETDPVLEKVLFPFLPFETR
jgi:hypothetical protein